MPVHGSGLLWMLLGPVMILGSYLLVFGSILRHSAFAELERV